MAETIHHPRRLSEETRRQRYLTYALSVISSRALPDVREQETQAGAAAHPLLHVP